MKAMRAAVAAISVLTAILAHAGAVSPDEILADPALEGRARAVSQELRCVVCQNQSIDDSNAPLAHDMRVLVRERITAGDSNAEVKAYLVARYGNFVLLKPPMGWQTGLLWFGPALMLAAAGFGFYRFMHSRDAASRDDLAALSDDEQRRVDELRAKGRA